MFSAPFEVIISLIRSAHAVAIWWTYAESRLTALVTRHAVGLVVVAKLVLRRRFVASVLKSSSL